MKVQSKRLKLLIIEILFILIAISFIIYPLLVHHGFPCDDTTFNMQRLNEIFKDVLHGQYPNYDYYSSYPLGTGIATMYPWLLITIFTPLSLFFKPLECWFIIIGIGMFIGLNISFWCFRRATKMRYLASAFFTITFCVSDEIMGWIYFNSDIGAYFAILLSPIAFFGWIYYYRSNKWKMMTLGLILMFSFHIMSGIVMVLIILAMTGLLHNHFNMKSIKNIGKTLICLLMATAIFWIPALTIGSSNNLNKPSLNYLNSSNELIVSTTRFFSTYNMRAWSLVDLLAICIILYCFKHFSIIARTLFGVAIGCILLNMSKLWELLVDITPCDWFQFAFRFDFITDLILMWLLTIALFKILPQKHPLRLTYDWLVILLVIIFGCEALSNYHIFTVNNHEKQQSYFSYGMQHSGKRHLTPNITDYNWKHRKYLSQQKVCSDYVPAGYDKFGTLWYVRNATPTKYKFNLNNIKIPSLINNKYIGAKEKQIQNQHPYYQYSSENYHNNLPLTKRYLTLTYIYRHRLPMQKYPSGVKFNTENTSKVIVPISVYEQQKYSYQLNHKTIHPTILKHNAIEIKHLHKHHTYTFTFHAPLMWFNYAGIIISIIDLILLLIF